MFLAASPPRLGPRPLAASAALVRGTPPAPRAQAPPESGAPAPLPAVQAAEPDSAVKALFPWGHLVGGKASDVVEAGAVGGPGQGAVAAAVDRPVDPFA